MGTTIVYIFLPTINGVFNFFKQCGIIIYVCLISDRLELHFPPQKSDSLYSI